MNSEYIIVLYIRLSSEDGDVGQDGKNESNSVANQRAMLRDYVSLHDDLADSTVMELCDDGYSGTNFERPAVKKLLELTKERRVHCIIVKDFSRFGREHIAVSDYVDQIFPFLGIRFISVNDGYDSEQCFGMTGGFDINLRNVINSFYSADISEKVRSGKRNKAMRGDFLSPFAPIGYRKDKNNKNQLLIDEDSASIVRFIFELAASGMSVLKITLLLNGDKTPTPSQLQNRKGFYHKWWIGLGGERIWDEGKVCAILRDERYLGTAVFGKRTRPEIGKYNTVVVDKSEWIVVSDCHEALISEELFEAAQSSLREFVPKGPQSMKKQHLFTGKLRCGHCGYALTRRTRPSIQYYCSTPYRKTDTVCSTSYISEQQIAEVVYKAIIEHCNILLDEQAVPKRKKNGSRSMTALKKQIAAFQKVSGKYENQKAELYEERASGHITKEQYVKKYQALQNEHEDIKRQLTELCEELSALELPTSYTLPEERQLNSYLGADTLTREMVLAFVDCIYIFDKHNIHIKWLFEEKGVQNEYEKNESRPVLQGSPC